MKEVGRERWVLKHCGRKNSRRRSGLRSFTGLESRAVSSGLICLCGLLGISSAHT